MDYTKMKYYESSFEDFIKQGKISHLDFKNESFDKKLQEVIKKYEQSQSMPYMINMLGCEDAIAFYKKNKLF